MLRIDESQREMATSIGILGVASVMATRNYDHTALYNSRPGGNAKFKKSYNTQYEFCKLKGHSRENYYKIVGYPYDFKYKKKGEHLL